MHDSNIPYRLPNRLFVCSSVQLHVYYMHPIVHLSIRSYILIYSFERPFVGLVFICSAVRPFVSKIVYAGVILSTARSFDRLFVCVRLFALNRFVHQCSPSVHLFIRQFNHSFVRPSERTIELNYLFINFSIPSFIYSTYILHTVCLLYYRFSYFNYIIHIYIIQMCVPKTKACWQWRIYRISKLGQIFADH